MKKLFFGILFLAALSSLGHFYLARRSYQLQTGLTETSKICNIGKDFSCDSALLSEYANVFGLSLSNFGLSFNLALCALLLFVFLFNGGAYWKNVSFYLSGLIALASVVLMTVSLAESLLCPVCWTLYLLSFLTLGGLFFAFKPDLSPPIVFVRQSLKQKSFYIFAGCCLLAGLFFHISFMTSFDIKNQSEDIEALFTDWQSATVAEIKSPALIEKGGRESRFVIVEFADFLCPACQKIQSALHTFLSRFPDTQLKFYAYPLDGACNPAVKFVGSGLRCQLSQALVCAQEQEKGWPLHDFIFQEQKRFLKNQGNKDKIKTLFDEMIAQTGLNKERFEICMKDPSSLQKVKQSALAGQAARVQGTPSFFVNGKKLMQDSYKLLILQRIRQSLH